MPTLQTTPLTKFVAQIFQAAGATEAGAELVAKSLAQANLTGHDSHGVIRVVQYLDSIASGELNPAAEPVITQEKGGTTMVDARYGFGQIAVHFVTQITVEKAQTHGVAATGLLNCNHVGRLGEWVELAAKANVIGLAFCNGGRPGGLVAPFGGAGRLLGTNPIAAAVPVAGQAPVMIDFATSLVPEGKVRVARNKGASIPEGMVLNRAGEPTTNPADLYDGGMLLPMAGHKGYGLSLLVELLGGLLTGQGCPALPNYKTLKNGVLFIGLAIDAFRPLTDFLADSAVLREHVKAVPPAPGFDEVLLPGEPEQRSAERRRVEGIPIDDTTWAQLVDAAMKLGVSSPE